MLWIAGILAFLVAASYAIGGRDLFRDLLRGGRVLRTRAVSVLQPPPQSPAQPVTVDTSSVAARIDRGTPVSSRFVLVWIGAILAIAVALFYHTGRVRRTSRRG